MQLPACKISGRPAATMAEEMQSGCQEYNKTAALVDVLYSIMNNCLAVCSSACIHLSAVIILMNE